MTGSIQEGTSDAETADLTESERHRILADEKRQAVLEVLADRSGPVDLEDLAREVAAPGRDGDAREREDVHQVVLSLHHVHLPKMADYGVVDYDTGACQVVSYPETLDDVMHS